MKPSDLWYKLLDASFREDGEPRAWLWGALVIAVITAAALLPK